MLLGLGSRFRPLFSLSLLLLSSSRAGIRLPIGIMLGTTSSFSLSLTEATAGVDVEHRDTGPMGHVRTLSEIIFSVWPHSGSAGPRPFHGL